MEDDIPLSTLPLQLEQAFVGCPLSFVRESLVSIGRRLTRLFGRIFGLYSKVSGKPTLKLVGDPS